MASSDFEEEDKQQSTRRKYSSPRTLMRWDAEKDQFLLLAVDHVCAKNGTPIPWDEVARIVEPNLTLSGEAIKQHLTKVRNYRAENEQRIPEKLEKGTRRRASLAANSANEETPVKGGRAKKIKKEQSDGEAVVDKPKRGQSLLYFKTPKKTKAPKNECGTNSTASTNRRSGGRKKKASDEASGEIFDTTTSTGKRGRKKAVKEEEDEESAHKSPTKKPRTRAKARVDYREEPAENDEEYGSVRNDCRKGYEDGTHEEVYDAHSYPATQTSFASSQGSTNGEIGSQPYAPPIAFGFNQAAPTAGMYNGSYGKPSLSGLPMRYAPDMIRPDTAHMSTHTNYCFGSFPPDIGMKCGGYSEAPNFSILNDPRREQELREAIGSKLPAVHTDASMNTFTEEKANQQTAPGTKATPNTKSNRNVAKSKTKKPETMSTPKSTQPASPTTVKIENPAVADDVFTQNTTDTIPIVDGTTEYRGSFNISDNMRGILETMLPTYHHDAPMNLLNTSFDTNIDHNANPSFPSNGSFAPMTPLLDSPTDMFGNHFNTPLAHTGITPGMSSMGFDNFYCGNQLSHTSSHSSSFDSVYQSDSNQAMPSIEPNDVTSFDGGLWNPNEYEMAYPGDEYANIYGGDGLNFYNL